MVSRVVRQLRAAQIADWLVLLTGAALILVAVQIP